MLVLHVPGATYRCVADVAYPQKAVTDLFSQIVQLLIERGSQYLAKNNQGFTPSDYAYSSVIRSHRVKGWHRTSVT